MALNVCVLAGGVGGAKLIDGLAQILPAADLTVVVNTGDDFDHLGLRICPDLDTIVYTLAGLASPSRGWGRAEETWHTLETVGTLGGPTWFQLGDKDLGLHLIRAERLRAGKRLSEVTAEICQAFGVAIGVLPMTDEEVSTIVETENDSLAFQTYFVKMKCEPVVRGFEFVGARQAEPAPGVLHAIERADLILIGPSNPWVSIDPILAIKPIRDAVQSKFTLAVSPIVAGEAVRGPAAKMFSQLGVEPSALAVAEHYGELIDAFVFDEKDERLQTAFDSLGVQAKAMNTIMQNPADRMQLAQDVLMFAQTSMLGV